MTPNTIIFYILIIASLVFVHLSLLTRSIFLLSIQFTCLAAAMFMLTTPFHRIAARRLWAKYSDDAEWEYADTVDDYCAEYNVRLEIYGYNFWGFGVISAGEKEITHIECDCPNGKTLEIV